MLKIKQSVFLLTNMLKRVTRILIVLVFMTVTLSVNTRVLAMPSEQISTAQRKAQALLEDLTPEERIGQLFLITFKNRDVGTNSQIYQLIVNRHIGGVVLTSANNNFTGPENTVAEISAMTNVLQTNEWDGSQIDLIDLATKGTLRSHYIPLFIGISQEGDGYPFDQIFNGVTPLPNQMAIGATWNPELAQNVGTVLGQELEALGFNLYMGPSLDVLDVTYSTGEDLGTRTFGSDPYWVGEMGKAYINGLHEGSDERLLVIAKHFPGRGGSDRPPEAEVATVRKSLEQLKQIELAPFFAVTGGGTEVESLTDGLLLSHIRYQGFQGNIRATTRPVSFDQVALDQLMALEPFATWRKNGGILVSDDLGSAAVRRFYDPTGKAFDARQVARNAFQAGNDLLYIDNFIATGDEDTYTTITRTLDFFIQKYREDGVFAKKVDDAVLRLLTLKYQLYPEFNLDSVIPPAEELANVGQSSMVTFEVAQNAVTLISPDESELSVILPDPPDIQERIVFISDTITKRQCSQCPEQKVFAIDALQNSVLKLYGPSAGSQVISSRVFSYSFNDLASYLDGSVSNAPIEDDLTYADWIIFCLQDVQTSRPSSLAMERFLSSQQNLLRTKKVIAFAFNAPYYLDATDISKLTAYYGIYSKSAPFIDAAARILFNELEPTGASPVSISGVGYDIIQATLPNPDQVIPLMVDLSAINASPDATVTSTPEPPPITTQIPPMFSVGDTLPLFTGTIYDYNNHPVPDGTVVRFIFTTTNGDISTSSQTETVTSKGIARTSYRIQTPGLIEIHVISEPATNSDLLQLDVSSEGASMVTAITQQPTQASTLTPESTSTATEISSQLQPTTQSTAASRTIPGGKDWILVVLVIAIAAAITYLIDQRKQGVRWATRHAILVVIGGLVLYCYLALYLPGSNEWIDKMGTWGILISTCVGISIGWCGGWIWRKNR